jgi:ElaB/YqjD/DUF883 family membrane-anchored ribosome-binding protein
MKNLKETFKNLENKSQNLWDEVQNEYQSLQKEAQEKLSGWDDQMKLEWKLITEDFAQLRTDIRDRIAFRDNWEKTKRDMSRLVKQIEHKSQIQTDKIGSQLTEGYETQKQEFESLFSQVEEKLDEEISGLSQKMKNLRRKMNKVVEVIKA